MKTTPRLRALLFALATAALVTPLSAIKITVPDQYQDQVEAIKEAERKEREQELEGVAESAEGGIEIAGEDKPQKEKPTVDADEFLVQSVVEATDAATEFEGTLAADEGIVSGQVVDEETGEPVSGAAILIEGTDIATVTDDSGRYSLGPAPAGIYTLSFIKTGYIEANITEYTVAGGEVSVFPFALPPRPADMSDEVYELQDFTVTAEEASSMMANLNLKRLDTASMLSSLGSDDFSRLGVSDVESIVKRISGVTTSGGRFAVVRGLEDRFSTTSMNDLVLPPPDPNRPAVPLDIFPASMIESVDVRKTFTPDMPGGSSGGNINIVTKSFPDEPTVKVSFGLEYDSNATAEDNFQQDSSGGSGDYFSNGFADRKLSNESFASSRGAPGPNSTLRVSYGDSWDISDSARIGLFATFQGKRSYSYREVKNQRLASGDEFVYDFEDLEFSSSPPVPRTGFFSAEGTNNKLRFPINSVGTSYESITTNDLSAFLSLAYEYEDVHSIQYNLFWSAVGEDVVSFTGDEIRPGGDGVGSPQTEFNDPDVQDIPDGQLEDGGPILSKALEYEQREYILNQIIGAHNPEGFLNGYVNIDWGVAFGKNSEDSVNRFYQENAVTVEAGASGAGSPGELFNEGSEELPFILNRELSQDNLVARVDLSTEPLELDDIWMENIVFSAGVYREEAKRDVETVEQQFQGTDTFLFDTDPATGNIVPKTAAFRSLESYAAEGDREIDAYYFRADLQATEKLKFVFGARLESTELSYVNTDGSFTASNLLGVGAGVTAASISVIDERKLLPSFSIIYEFNEKISVRAAYSQTTARPSFREIAPFFSYNADTGTTEVGNFGQLVSATSGFPYFDNPGLSTSDVENVDFRIDYINDDEMVGLSLFYKEVKDPIEQIELGLGEDIFSWENNENTGQVMGLEFEARKNLGFIHESLDNFTVGGNFTLLESWVSRSPREETRFVKDQPSTSIPGLVDFIVPPSLVDEEPERPLFDQPEYLLNLYLSYSNEDLGLDATISYFAQGDSLYAVGSSGVDGSEPGIPRSADSPDLYKQGYGELNFVLSKKFADNWKVSFSAKNLTDSTREIKYDDITGDGTSFRSYKKGIRYGISVSWDM